MLWEAWAWVPLETQGGSSGCNSLGILRGACWQVEVTAAAQGTLGVVPVVLQASSVTGLALGSTWAALGSTWAAPLTCQASNWLSNSSSSSSS